MIQNNEFECFDLINPKEVLEVLYRDVCCFTYLTWFVITYIL